MNLELKKFDMKKLHLNQMKIKDLLLFLLVDVIQVKVF